MSIGVLKSICVDFSDESLYQYITVFSEEIYSRTIEITPLNNGEEYIIPAETTARLEARKPDNKPILLDSKIDFTNNKIYIELTPKCLDTPGVTSCQIGLYGVDNRFIASSYFYIDVYRSALSGNGSVNHPGCNSNVVESSPEYQSFRVALLSVDEVQKRANTAILKAENDISNAIQNMDVEIDDAVNKVSESAEEAIENVKETNESVSKNELEREENETQRQQNEQLRDAAEEDRKKEFEAMVTDFGDLGGIAVSKEEPESERVVAWIDPSDDEKTLFMTSDDIAQELGDSEEKVLSQKAVTVEIGNVVSAVKSDERTGYLAHGTLEKNPTYKFILIPAENFIGKTISLKADVKTYCNCFKNIDENLNYEEVYSPVFADNYSYVIPDETEYIYITTVINDASVIYEYLCFDTVDYSKSIFENLHKIDKKIGETAERLSASIGTVDYDKDGINGYLDYTNAPDLSVAKNETYKFLLIPVAEGQTVEIQSDIKIYSGIIKDWDGTTATSVNDISYTTEKTMVCGSGAEYLYITNFVGGITPNYTIRIDGLDIHKTIAENLKDVIGAYAHKRVSVVGDSYSTFDGFMVDTTAGISYYDEADTRGTGVTDYRQTWWGMFINKQKCMLEYNNSRGGTTICNTGYDGANVSDRSLSTRCKNIGRPDIIFVFGGTNDSWAGSPLGEYKYSGWTADDLKNFRPAFAYMLDYLIKHNPNAKIYNITNTRGTIGADVQDSQIAVCEHYGITNIVLSGIDMTNGHPTAAGMESIYNQIVVAIS